MGSWIVKWISENLNAKPQRAQSPRRTGYGVFWAGEARPEHPIFPLFLRDFEAAERTIKNPKKEYE
jgi:hypothetical protein